jgi:hypothetical protein
VLALVARHALPATIAIAGEAWASSASSSSSSSTDVGGLAELFGALARALLDRASLVL